MDTNERRSSGRMTCPRPDCPICGPWEAAPVARVTRPASLPIASIEPLTAAEREALRCLAVVFRSAAANIDGVLAAVGTQGRARVDQALQSLGLAFTAGDRAREVAALLGRGR